MTGALSAIKVSVLDNPLREREPLWAVPAAQEPPCWTRHASGSEPPTSKEPLDKVSETFVPKGLEAAVNLQRVERKQKTLTVKLQDRHRGIKVRA
jgi:hypothetical protein